MAVRDLLWKKSWLQPEQRGEHWRFAEPDHFEAKLWDPGHHEHHGEAEMYYILEGTGMYEEDGEAVAVEAGDVTYCEDGHGHGLKNNGKEELVMVAVILKK